MSHAYGYPYERANGLHRGRGVGYAALDRSQYPRGRSLADAAMTTWVLLILTMLGNGTVQIERRGIFDDRMTCETVRQMSMLDGVCVKRPEA